MKYNTRKFPAIQINTETVIETEDGKVYVYPFSCPNCEEGNRKKEYESKSKCSQFLFTCTCQAEFECFPLMNQQPKPAIMVHNV
jgi:hypothetical protein